MGSVLWRRGIANLPTEDWPQGRCGLVDREEGMGGGAAAKDPVYLEAACIMTQRPRRACGAHRSPVGLVTPLVTRFVGALASVPVTASLAQVTTGDFFFGVTVSNSSGSSRCFPAEAEKPKRSM